MNPSVESVMEGCVAVLDIGKSNVKLSAVSLAGHIIETASTANVVLSGAPWRHHDLTGLADWAFSNLAALCRRYPIRHFIPVGHGSAGVLVGNDPDSANGGAMLPMMDYEQQVPAGLNDAYRPLAGSFFDRGSSIMQSATHQARQMFWMQRDQPAAFAKAHCYLGLPQYWAWRMSGVVANDYSIMGAQSQLWNGVDKRFAPIVSTQGWHRLMPPFFPAWAKLGTVRESLARRYNLPADISVHTGGHDSSINFYRYQAAGHKNLTVVSTGTWIVALSDNVNLVDLDETRGMTCNNAVNGEPLGGALTMGGREFTLVAGPQDAEQSPKEAPTDIAILAKLIEQGTMALPAFGGDSGQFPNSAGRGRIIGPPPVGPAERRALALLYTALLTSVCVATLGHNRRVVLDGSFLRDPLYASLVAALRPEAETFYNLESYGVASGAALLCSHTTRTAEADVALTPVNNLPQFRPVLQYAQRWLSETQS